MPNGNQKRESYAKSRALKTTRTCYLERQNTCGVQISEKTPITNLQERSKLQPSREDLIDKKIKDNALTQGLEDAFLLVHTAGRPPDEPFCCNTQRSAGRNTPIEKNWSTLQVIMLWHCTPAPDSLFSYCTETAVVWSLSSSRFPHHVDALNIITTLLQVALRAVVLQLGVTWFGSRYLLVVSTIVSQDLVQSGAGVESYSDASSGMATIMRNEVKWTNFFLILYCHMICSAISLPRMYPCAVIL
jgi:hypothetical protein